MSNVHVYTIWKKEKKKKLFEIFESNTIMIYMGFFLNYIFEKIINSIQFEKGCMSKPLDITEII